MRRIVFFVMLVAVVASGCRKKHSMEFGLYKADYTALVDQQGDDAFLSPQMDEVVTKLKSVNPETVEGPEAQALVDTIAQEKTRVTADRAAKAKAVAEAAAAPPAPAFPQPSTPIDLSKVGQIPNLDVVDAGVVDAGAPEKIDVRPEAGMPEADFLKRFGSCFESPRPVALLSGSVQAYKVKERPDCARYGTPNTSWYFASGKLAGTFTEEVSKPQPNPPSDEEPKKTEAPPAPPPKPQVVYPSAPDSVTIP